MLEFVEIKLPDVILLSMILTAVILTAVNEPAIRIFPPRVILPDTLKLSVLMNVLNIFVA